MQAHAAAIETYINELVGILGDDEMGDVYFQRTLEDWARFNINNRTKTRCLYKLWISHYGL